MTKAAPHSPSVHCGLVALVATLVALTPAASQACGACVEDKVAATYDDLVRVRAAAAGDVVVYCAIAGRFDPQRLTQALRRVPGIRAHSVRTSSQPAAVSFAVDPQRQSAQAAVMAAQRSLSAGTRLTIVQVVKPPLHEYHALRVPLL